MTMPLAMIKPDQAAQMLSKAWVNIARSDTGPDDRTPTLLLVLPPAWNNRYQPLLYGEAGPRRYVPMGIANTAILRHISWPGPIVLHAHWFAGLFVGCDDEIAAMEQLENLQEQVAAFRARTGARLVWTAHNVFPHGNLFPQTFRALRQWIFETFDAVHVMHDDHVPLLEAAFGHKAPPTFTVPHMLYENCHPDGVRRQAARVQYGISQDSFVFAYFGSIHPYKNLRAMLEAFDRLAATSGRPMNAIIGGVPSDPSTVQALHRGWGANPRVRLLMKNIPDHEIQYIHRAADAMVLPYAESLNSGAAFMAASFDLPFVMPEGNAARSLRGLGAMFYDPARPDGLEDAMRAVMAGRSATVDKKAKVRHKADNISALFFDQLDRILERTFAAA